MKKSLWLFIGAAALLYFAAAAAIAQAAASNGADGNAAAASQTDAFAVLDQWEYVWEDRAIDAPVRPPVSGADGQPPRWERIASPLNPPGRDGRAILWLRTVLPGGNWNEPTLKLRAYQLFEVYSGERMIYRFGSINPSGASDYLGTPHRLVPLPWEAMGKPLYIRVYSDGSNIGIAGAAKVGARSDFILELLKEQSGRVILGCMFMFMGLASIYPFVRLRQILFFSFGCFAVLFGLYTITRTALIYLFLDSPMLWTYAELAALIGSAASIVAFFGQMFGEERRSLIAYLWRFHLLYGAGYLAFASMGVVCIPAGLFLYQIILIASMLLLFVRLLVQVRKGRRDARILLAGSTVFFVTVFTDIIGNMLFPEDPLPLLSYCGVLLFFLALLSVLIRRFGEMIARLSNSEKLSVAGQLAAGVAHEIRNPLTVISGYLQLMKQDVMNKGMIDIMLAEVNRINLIMNEFLFLAKPAEPKLALHSIRDIIGDVLLFFEAQAAASRVTLRLDCPEELPLLACDQNQLKQVFVNILKNALEAMADGGEIDIKVKAVEREDLMLIRFTDQGCGISREDLAMIGEPFFTTKENGNGLGIMVTRSIIEQHKGHFRIESQPGVGTTVEIALPLAKKQAEPPRFPSAGKERMQGQSQLVRQQRL